MSISKSHETFSLRSLRKVGFTLQQFILMFMVAVVVVAGFYLSRVNDVVVEQNTELERSMQRNLTQANQQINSLNLGVRNLLLSVSTRQDIFELSEHEVTRLLHDIKASNTLAKVLYSANEQGQITSSNHSLYVAQGSPELQAAVEVARQNPSVLYYSEPYYSHMVAGYTVCAALAVDSGTKVIAAELNLDALYASLSPLLGDNGKLFFVASHRGNLFLLDRTSDELLLAKGQYPLRADDSYTDFVQTIQNQDTPAVLPIHPDYKYIASNRNDLHWRVFLLYQHVLHEANWGQTYQGLYLIAFVWIILLGGVLLAISFGFTKPLRSLAVTMENINNIDDLSPILNERSDEIGRLRNNYNSLVQRIHGLLRELRETEKKKRRYEIQMLQNQIAPHFLHNTLTCIACLIRQGQPMQAETGIKALVGLLSYSFDRTDEMTSIQDELDMLHNYVRIQTMRYSEVFTFDARVKPETLDCKLPKLTLQPIIENAIFHGVLPRGDDAGRIVVAVVPHGSDVFIRIHDNGVGIPLDECEQILLGKSPVRKEGRLSGIGVSNVHERVQLLFGSAYGLKIKSRVGRGTVMQIKLPKTK